MITVMNKKFLMGSLAVAMGLSVISCNKDGYTEMTRTLGAPAVSIITSLSDGTVTASTGTYAFNIKITDTSNTGTITSPDLIANNTSLNFTTDDQAYKSTGYDAFFENVSGKVNNSNMELNNANFLAIYLYDETYNKYGYYYNDAKIGDYTFVLNPYAPYLTVAKYNLGSSYRVNTFPGNSFFKGNTVTTYPQSETPFQTDKIMYRVMINQDKETKEFTADMIIYDAKFSGVPAEPTKEAILVPNLKVDFTPNGISITGTEVEPLVYEAQGYTPYPAFTFNDIEFHTTNDLYTTAEINYTVAKVFKGHFEGSYLNTYYMSGK